MRCHDDERSVVSLCRPRRRTEPGTAVADAQERHDGNLAAVHGRHCCWTTVKRAAGDRRRRDRIGCSDPTTGSSRTATPPSVDRKPRRAAGACQASQSRRSHPATQAQECLNAPESPGIRGTRARSNGERGCGARPSWRGSGSSAARIHGGRAQRSRLIAPALYRATVGGVRERCAVRRLPRHVVGASA